MKACSRPRTPLRTSGGGESRSGRKIHRRKKRVGSTPTSGTNPEAVYPTASSSVRGVSGLPERRGRPPTRRRLRIGSSRSTRANAAHPRERTPRRARSDARRAAPARGRARSARTRSPAAARTARTRRRFLMHEAPAAARCLASSTQRSAPAPPAHHRRAPVRRRRLHRRAITCPVSAHSGATGSRDDESQDRDERFRGRVTKNGDPRRFQRRAAARASAENAPDPPAAPPGSPYPRRRTRTRATRKPWHGSCFARMLEIEEVP